MTELRLIVSTAAQRDIDGIGRFIAQDNATAARNFVDRLTSCFERLQAMPGIGSMRDELEPGLLGRAFGNYIIYYRVIEGNLLIQRIIHGARDQSATLDAADESPQ
ncbi:MAG: type II toxin-antitoxin system RelE/ParE family toxin [Blastomonas sp.]